MKPRRPIVRYHGGKWRLAPWIISHFPEHRIYVEPFGGSASVLIQKHRSYSEVWNDLDLELYNLFNVARSRPEELIRAVALTPFHRRDYQISFEPTHNVLEQARRTLARSFMGFGSNSLCRSKKSGFRSCSNRSGTTPAHDWRNFPHALSAIIERLRGVVFESRDALEVMQSHDSIETLHYCDPPYVHSERSAFRAGQSGYSHEMSDDDHRRFLEFVCALKGSVIISGYANHIYDSALVDWTRVEKTAFADGAKKRKEVLWLKLNTHQPQLL